MSLDLDAIKARADAASKPPWDAHADGLVWAQRLGDPVCGASDPDDAAFIAHARTDVLELVAEVAALRRVLGELADVDGDDPCERDHRGGCQTHNHLGLTHDDRCPVAEARDLLGGSS